jgi:hypothetical protein
MMRREGVSITRENYIRFAYDEPPEEWGAEDEAQMPDELRLGDQDDEDDEDD